LGFIICKRLQANSYLADEVPVPALARSVDAGFLFTIDISNPALQVMTWGLMVTIRLWLSLSIFIDNRFRN
jgi:hypothetical protein